MEVIQIIKKLNNTELGKKNTHESYILVNRGLDISDLFKKTNVPLQFIFKKNNKEVITIRKTEGRETRIVGLGPFYRKYNLEAGDDIILEKRIGKTENNFYIDFKKNADKLYLQKTRGLFQVLTNDRLSLLDNTFLIIDSESKKVELRCIKSCMKRSDSPEETKLYDFLLGGMSIKDRYINNEIVELSVINGRIKIFKPILWKKIVLEWEG
ncbi:hypothetical protein SAMN04489758_11132 [Thomasclavelia cocleata]|uniref:Uncharacterized protein n=2 Tax=Thomasclavelia cocleata TaxID=69824 RepID=A0A1I0EH57_9FIRM|nr:hypothetical protein [Thomasclavelia cocleata]MCR1959337.1 hypothetical protein [Thomasclavelia cocleata]NDO42365.1 hypothetical protein [Thomasclavelia cocleata]SET44493.1 hypothetical protein SAMN04489758_11132 [Thomasclavelia cocleata]